jgi:hypothetical protein
MTAALKEARLKTKPASKKKRPQLETEPVEPDQPVDERIAAKRGGQAPIRDFASKPIRSSVNDVAQAPPTLTFGKKATSSKGVPLSISQQEALAIERERAIQR